FVFRGAIAPICVGMVPFNQLLVASLDRPLVGAGVQFQRCQSLKGDDIVTRLAGAGARASAPIDARFAKNRLVRAVAPGLRAALGAHAPSGTVTNYLVLLVFAERLVVHAPEVVVGGVIFADMIDAEREILPFALASHRRAIKTIAQAARVIAAHGGRARIL